MRILLRLAIRNLARHPWRSSATILGVGLGIASVLATLSVGANIKANLGGALEAAAGKTDLLVIPGASGRAFFESNKIIASIEDDLAISTIYPVLNYRAEPVREIENFKAPMIPGIDSGFQLSGRITESGEDLPVVLASGVLPKQGTNGIALSNGFAESRGYDIGETINFATQFGEIPFHITGLLDEGHGLASNNGGRVGLVHIADLQKAVRLLGRASLLELHLTSEANVEETQDRLMAQLGPTSTVVLPASIGNFATGLTDTLQSGLTILAATLMALGAFMAYNTFAAAVIERTTEYALLRTICLLRREIGLIAILEAAIVGLLGVISGTILGVILSYIVTRFNAWALGFEYRTLVFPLDAVLLASTVGLASSLIAGWLPAKVASRTSPLAANRGAYVTHEPAIPSKLLSLTLLCLGIVTAITPWNGVWAIAASAIAMALLFAGLTLLAPIFLTPLVNHLTPYFVFFVGIPGRLGANFTKRNAARNSVAISSVVLGMGLTIGVGSMVTGIHRSIETWVDTTVVGDLFVTTPVNFPDGFALEVAQQIPEIDVISGVGIRVVRYLPEGVPNGRTVALVLIDPERFNPDSGFGSFQYIRDQGNALTGYEALKQGGAVLAANTIHEKFSVALGSNVKLRTSKGFRDFPVSGIVVDFTGGGETFVGSINDVDLFGGGSPDLFVMTVKDGFLQEQVREQLLKTFPHLFLDITLNKSYREQIQSLARRSFLTTNGLLLLTIFVAALGVSNTLGMNLSNRQHEIAVLRTLGLTRKEISSMIATEGVIINLVGALLGIAVGMLLAQVITTGASELTGFSINPIFPWRLIIIAFVTSPIIGLLAAYFPAKRASQLPPNLALNSE